MSQIEKIVVVALRLIGFTLTIIGLILATSNILQTYDQIDLTYLDLFLRTRLIPPATWIIFGAVIYLTSGFLARHLTPRE